MKTLFVAVALLAVPVTTWAGNELRARAYHNHHAAHDLGNAMVRGVMTGRIRSGVDLYRVAQRGIRAQRIGARRNSALRGAGAQHQAITLSGGRPMSISYATMQRLRQR